jgi:hypothetical protein
MLKRLTALLALCFSASTMAAGPLILEGASGHVPAKYENPNIEFNIETGMLGSRTNSEADLLVNNAFNVWNLISTSTINIIAGDDIPEDINASNFTDYIPDPTSDTSHRDDDNLNPVVYDNDGKIIDAFFGENASESVVGFAASSIIVGTEYFTEGFVVINGNLPPQVDDYLLTLIVAHETGHVLGLDHSQLNISNTESLNDRCPSTINQDTTMYPLMYPYACRYEQISPTHPDDDISLSTLYPIPGYYQSQGQLTGKLVTTSGEPVRGANLWVKNINTQQTFSIVSDYLKQCTGFFALMLPPGEYELHANSVNDEFYDGSGVGPWAEDQNDASFQPPASSLGADVVFSAELSTSATFTLAAGTSVDIVFRTDGSGSITTSDSQVDLTQIYNAAGSCSVSDTDSDGGSGSPSLPLLTALLCLPLLRRIRQG